MTAGGRRKGSGRPKNSGKYQETTTAIRVPTRLVGYVRRYVDALMTDKDTAIWMEQHKVVTPSAQSI